MTTTLRSAAAFDRHYLGPEARDVQLEPYNIVVTFNHIAATRGHQYRVATDAPVLDDLGPGQVVDLIDAIQAHVAALIDHPVTIHLGRGRMAGRVRAAGDVVASFVLTIEEARP